VLWWVPSARECDGRVRVYGPYGHVCMCGMGGCAGVHAWVHAHDVHIYIYIYIYMCKTIDMYIDIYIYIERESEWGRVCV
jgi:hypothetical protein